MRELLVDLRPHLPSLERAIVCKLAWFPEEHGDSEVESQEVRAECALAGVGLQVVFDWLSLELYTGRKIEQLN